MNALVLYDSLYGNTARIARAIGAAMAERGPVAVRSIGEVEALPPALDLLVVGGPTQGHGVDPAMKTFLDGLPAEAVRGVAVATFDTRLHWPKLLSGAAAPGIAERLAKKGARLIVEPESFIVKGKDGPLADGELDRAAAWGRRVTAATPAALA